MTGDVISLRKVRKAKARALRESEAAENRVKFGRTKAQRLEIESTAKLAVRRLEGHRLAGDKAGTGDDASSTPDGGTDDPERKA